MPSHLHRDLCPGSANMRRELVLDMLRQLHDRRMIEHFGQIDESRKIPADVLVDLDQFEGTRAYLEQVVVDVDAWAWQDCLAQDLQAGFEFGTTGDRPSITARDQAFKLSQVSVEVTVDVSLLQHVPLHFTAGGLRNLPYRNDFRNL